MLHKIHSNINVQNNYDVKNSSLQSPKIVCKICSWLVVCSQLLLAERVIPTAGKRVPKFHALEIIRITSCYQNDLARTQNIEKGFLYPSKKRVDSTGRKEQ